MLGRRGAEAPRGGDVATWGGGSVATSRGGMLRPGALGGEDLGGGLGACGEGGGYAGQGRGVVGGGEEPGLEG